MTTSLNDLPNAISLPQMSHSLLGDTQDQCGHSIEKTIHSHDVGNMSKELKTYLMDRKVWSTRKYINRKGDTDNKVEDDANIVQTLVHGHYYIETEAHYTAITIYQYSILLVGNTYSIITKKNYIYFSLQ